MYIVYLSSTYTACIPRNVALLMSMSSEGKLRREKERVLQLPRTARPHSVVNLLVNDVTTKWLEVRNIAESDLLAIFISFKINKKAITYNEQVGL